MLKKGSKGYSILTGTCPKCHGESMYTHPNPYHLGSIFEMHTRCAQCGTKYKIEPSFFFGAMYVSYGVGIAFATAVFIIAYILIGTSLINSFIAIVTILILSMPVIIRLSRNIWINFFVKYDKMADQS